VTTSTISEKILQRAFVQLTRKERHSVTRAVPNHSVETRGFGGYLRFSPAEHARLGHIDSVRHVVFQRVITTAGATGCEPVSPDGVEARAECSTSAKQVTLKIWHIY
jgi:hypothetical protein